VNSTLSIREMQKTATERIDAYAHFAFQHHDRNPKHPEVHLRGIIRQLRCSQRVQKPQKRGVAKYNMTHLRDVKMIKDRTFEEIEPMKQTIMLLKKHQVKMDEDFLVKLEIAKLIS